MTPSPLPPRPITEDDLQAWVDQRLSPQRQREVDAHLAAHPDEARRLDHYRAQNAALRAHFNPVLDEPVPARLQDLARAAAPQRARTAWLAGPRWVAGVALVLVGGALGWGLRGVQGDGGASLLAQRREPLAVHASTAPGLAQRAAVAHAVYSPEQRRPVEVDAAHEDQLVAWLSKRMGAPMRPPQLQALGYALEGGRLLPGSVGPVAQFMYRDTAGQRLTLYVSQEGAAPAAGAASATAPDTAFQFTRQQNLNVFYWMDGPFGYALSAGVDRGELARVSAEVYRQITPSR